MKTIWKRVRELLDRHLDCPPPDDEVVALIEAVRRETIEGIGAVQLNDGTEKLFSPENVLATLDSLREEIAIRDQRIAVLLEENERIRNTVNAVFEDLMRTGEQMHISKMRCLHAIDPERHGAVPLPGTGEKP